MTSQSLRAIRTATSLTELATACNNVVAKLPHELNDITKKVAEHLSFKLIYITPVDTSQALSNWQIGLMLPEFDAIPAYVLGEEGSTAGASQTIAYFKAQNTIAQRMPNTPIFLSNNAPYIDKLNQGKSEQQSAGFVERAIIEAETEANKLSRELIYGD